MRPEESETRNFAIGTSISALQKILYLGAATLEKRLAAPAANVDEEAIGSASNSRPITIPIPMRSGECHPHPVSALFPISEWVRFPSPAPVFQSVSNFAIHFAIR
jgi:hypothetical protein